MKGFKQLAHFLFNAAKDERILPTHISLYLAIFWKWKTQNYIIPFPVFRKDLMHIAHISSTATYHKCIKELCCFGYITYAPSYNYYRGSFICLLDH